MVFEEKKGGLATNNFYYMPHTIKYYLLLGQTNFSQKWM